MESKISIFEIVLLILFLQLNARVAKLEGKDQLQTINVGPKLKFIIWIIVLVALPVAIYVAYETS